jgi:hypothetical protein
MKRCPTCQRVYEDDGMSYCLEDGAALVSALKSSYDPGVTMRIPPPQLTNQAPTEVLPKGDTLVSQRPPQTNRRHDAFAGTAGPKHKQSALPWIFGAALILGLSGIIIALIVTRSRDAEKSQTAKEIAQSESTPPVPTPIPTRDAPGKVQTNKTPEQFSPTPEPELTTGRYTEDEKHRLFQTVGITRDNALIIEVAQKIGIVDAKGQPKSSFQTFVNEHYSWAPKNGEFIRQYLNPEKAREYVMANK